MDKHVFRRRDTLLLGLGFEGGFVIVAWLLGWLLHQPPLDQFHWRVADAGWGLAACVPLLAGLWLGLRWPIGPLRRIKRFSVEVIRPLFQPCTVLDLAGISLLAGLGEEMLFRGVLQGWLTARIGTWLALAVTSVLFGILHPITLTYALLAALCGAYFGIIFIHTDNLLAVVIPHAVYDFIALLCLSRLPGPPPPLERSQPG
jgi:membrane protease YdiL (CAAX protease family)